jgi:hypothetical protein
MVTLRCTFGVQRDLFLLPPFLDHYLKLGVSDFRIILHSPVARSAELEAAKDLLAMRGLTPASIWITDSWNTGENAARHRDAVADLSDDTWILSADADEFHIYPQLLPEFIRTIEQQGVSVVQGRLVDFVARDWRLHRPMPEVSLFEQCPVRADPFFRFPGNPGKVMLHRNYVQTAPGHHNYLMGGDREIVEFNEILTVAHFKWFASVTEKYTDPTKIAHHSDSWMYAIYHQQINRNFVGWGRILNLLLHSPAGNFFRPCLNFLHRALRHGMCVPRRT